MSPSLRSVLHKIREARVGSGILIVKVMAPLLGKEEAMKESILSFDRVAPLTD